MSERRTQYLALAFVLCLIIVGIAFWTTRPDESAERVESCVEMLGESARERCEQMEAERQS